MKTGLSRLHIEPCITQKAWETDGIPVLFSTVSLPRPISEDRPVCHRIRRFYALQGRAYLRYCERWLYPQAAAACRAALETSAPLPQVHTELTYHITYHDDRFLSLYTQSRETLNGEAFFTRHGDTWDLSAGFPAAPDSFFPPRSRWRSHLIACAAEEIRRQERLGASHYRPDWSKLLRRRLNPRNFYLTPEGVVFFYPMYAIASAQAGIPTFLAPYDTKKAPALLRRGP